MRKVNVSDFKARCLALIEDVATTGEPLEILKRGEPVARVIRVRRTKHIHPQDALKGKARILGDIVGPVMPDKEWDMHRE